MPIPIPLAVWRTRRLLTQEELSARSGVSTAAISRIERGAAARFETVRRLVKTLGLHTEFEEYLRGEGTTAVERARVGHKSGSRSRREPEGRGAESPRPPAHGGGAPEETGRSGSPG